MTTPKFKVGDRARVERTPRDGSAFGTKVITVGCVGTMNDREVISQASGDEVYWLGGEAWYAERAIKLDPDILIGTIVKSNSDGPYVRKVLALVTQDGAKYAVIESTGHGATPLVRTLDRLTIVD